MWTQVWRRTTMLAVPFKWMLSNTIGCQKTVRDELSWLSFFLIPALLVPGPFSHTSGRYERLDQSNKCEEYSYDR